ncbi:MAG: hypothetical protein R3Y09_08955 [Clostridia bacterium]
MSLKKAKILVLGESDAVKDTIECSFNPSEYKISNEVNYSESKTLGESGNQVSTTTISTFSTLNLTLYFSSATAEDLYKKGVMQDLSSTSVKPVTDITQKIVDTAYIDGSLHKPPVIKFVWGNLNYRGVVTNITETYTMFTSSGKPIRAKLDLTIKESVDGLYSTKSHPFESPDRTKWVTLTEGMSFWDLANTHYGDAGRWRIIAEANDIDNPLLIEKGKIIKIPAI